MKRRKAIRSIGVISAGIALLPACQVPDSIPIYENLPLESEQYRLVEWLTKAILPAGETTISTPESRVQFVLTMINDCYAPKDIERYATGLKLFKQYIQDRYQSSFTDLNAEQQVLLFTEMAASKIFPKDLQYFLQTSKRLSVQHFTSAEYFMVNHLNFEFVPGRFHGCVPV